MNLGKKHTMFKNQFSINIGGKLLDLTRPIVMGILNVTPDSFYDGGKYNNSEKVLKRTEEIISEGGKIIDIGGMSSRPGSFTITEKEEINRIVPVAKLIRKYFPDAIISIDTFRSSVVKKVYNEIGAVIINDISGGNFDENMFKVIAKHQLPYIMMHIQGTPENMQQNPQYEDITIDIIKQFSLKVAKLMSLGAKDIIIDPGFGFGKTLNQNYELLNRMDEFKIMDLPIMVGLSRKSMIYKALNISPDDALNGTILLHGFALERGANILRVHDVKEAYDSIKLFERFNSI